MKIEKLVLTRVEGEASLNLVWERGVIKDAKISFYSTRGIEKVLRERPFMDALVINPRICGICGHAHLIATVRAIENAIGIKEIPEKAKITRLVTQITEMVQNHVKWFYLFVMPDFLKFKESLSQFEPFKGERWKRAVQFSSQIVKIIALFGGQWPHSSYAVPGGITSNFSEREVLKALNLVKEGKTFFEKNVSEDLELFLNLCEEFNLLSIGKAYNRFLSGGGLAYCFNPSYKKGKGKVCKFNVRYVQELEAADYSKANPVRYKGLPYETGPLARELISKNPLVLKLYKNYGDSYAVRVAARLAEIKDLLEILEKLLKELMNHLEEPSCLWEDRSDESGEGFGVVEAARGTLIHRVVIEKGKIKDYKVITPSQWNLGPRCKKYLGVAEKAIVGLDSELKAQMVLRSFDLCSVCTTK
ncbi:nickel-dependent hydrogenase large subunit [Aquifex aeolicus]|uniref:Hydrogenase large subunit n=1 Tax=Aquifex aeolicus (strain VF5) TaxID=224324 RepID=O66988_AQUAE|nr:nickel-dependent hydrogenase large subunit [Aquifex aeolicus]AAC06945.1 hydrogenase large subunit [Aquifex aeolicus VF5]